MAFFNHLTFPDRVRALALADKKIVLAGECVRYGSRDEVVGLSQQILGVYNNEAEMLKDLGGVKFFEPNRNDYDSVEWIETVGSALRHQLEQEEYEINRARDIQMDIIDPCPF